MAKGQSLQTARSWTNLEVKGKMQPLLEKAPAGLSGAQRSEQKDKGPGLSVRRVRLPLNRVWRSHHLRPTRRQGGCVRLQGMARLTEGEKPRTCVKRVYFFACWRAMVQGLCSYKTASTQLKVCSSGALEL